MFSKVEWSPCLFEEQGHNIPLQQLPFLSEIPLEVLLGLPPDFTLISVIKPASFCSKKFWPITSALKYSEATFSFKEYTMNETITTAINGTTVVT